MSLLPDAEGCEDAVQYVFDIHHPDKVVKSANRFLDMMRGQHGVAPGKKGFFGAFQSRPRLFERRAVPFPGQYRLEIGQCTSLPEESLNYHPAQRIQPFAGH